MRRKAKSVLRTIPGQYEDQADQTWFSTMPKHELTLRNASSNSVNLFPKKQDSQMSDRDVTAMTLNNIIVQNDFNKEQKLLKLEKK